MAPTPASSRVNLAESRVFDGLSAADRRVWLDAATIREARAGQTVASQGDPADVFAIVSQGRLKLLQVTAGGDELIVRFIWPGEPFGGVVALKAGRYPVTAIAVGATELYQWRADQLKTLLDRFPLVRENLMREMAAHMNDAMTRLQELSTERASQRIAHALLRLMRQSGERAPDGIALRHRLTRQDLAQLSGTTLYTVSRTLSRWQSAGILRTSRHGLVIRSFDDLEAQARHADEP
jgi:CRP-like cAMP-binding protein